jgi:hypothetical protein
MTANYAQGGAGRPGKWGCQWPAGRRLVMHMLPLLFFCVLARLLPPNAAARLPELHNLQIQVGQQISLPAASALFDIVQNTSAGNVFIIIAWRVKSELDSRAMLPRIFRRWARNRLLRCRIGLWIRDSPTNLTESNRESSKK